MKQSIQQKISQGLAMTQQLQQAIFLLQLSSIELKAEIQEKLESNLMLEIEDDEVEENVNEQSEIEEASSNEKIEDIDIETIGEENFENSLTNKKTNSENQSTVFEFEEEDGSYKTGDPVLDENGDQVVTLGVKSVLKAQEKVTAGSLLARYDWYVVRKAEKSTAIPTAISTYRDGVRTACNTRETEIDACADTAALVTLYSYKDDGTAYMTQYPADPNS